MVISRTVEPTPKRVTFLDESSFTFVNYGSDNNFTYRKEARTHNAHRRVRDTQAPGCISKCDARERTEAAVTPTATRHSSRAFHNRVNSIRTSKTLSTTRTNQRVATASPVWSLGPPSMLNGMSRHSNPVARRQFLECQWRSTFQYSFYLPQVDNIAGLQNPQSAFLTAAYTNMQNYRNLVFQPVISLAALRGEEPSETVFRNQALILQNFRQLAERYIKPELQLTREQFQGFLATTFAFHIHNPYTASAYDIIMYANSSLFMMPQNLTIKHLPTVEWIRTLMPLPGPTFYQSHAYRVGIVRKITRVFEFIDDIKQRVQQRCYHEVHHYLIPRTALYRLVTTEIPDTPMIEPYKGFHSVCLHRVFFLLHAYLNNNQRSCTEAVDSMFTMLQSIAEACVAHEFPHSITLFLWYLLVLFDEQNQFSDPVEPLFSWAVRELINVHNLSLIPDLRALLFHRTGLVGPLNVRAPGPDDIHKKMRTFYRVDDG